METANLMLALGGERDNQVPKFSVTPAELLLLRALHGEDAVTDVVVLDEALDTTSREERERLFHLYARPVPGKGRACPQLDGLFPGVAAVLPKTFEDLELDDAVYAVERAAPRKKRPDPLDHDGDGRKGGSKKGGRKAKKTEADAASEEEADEDAEDSDNSGVLS